MSDTPGPDRDQPELTELNLLLEQYDEESDPARKEELKRQIEKMEREVEEANRK